MVGPHTGKGPDDRRSAVLRAGRFATNSLGWAPEIRAGDVVRLPNAAAGRSPIDPRDVADAALAYWAKLVAEPEPITRTVEEITGSPARTFREWATEHADDLR